MHAIRRIDDMRHRILSFARTALPLVTAATAPAFAQDQAAIRLTGETERGLAPLGL